MNKGDKICTIITALNYSQKISEEKNKTFSIAANILVVISMNFSRVPSAKCTLVLFVSKTPKIH